MNEDFISLMQKRIVRGSIGPSTLRGMGPKGTIERVRLYLCKIDLRDFKVRSGKGFNKVLDRHTSLLKRKLPKGAQHFGSTRKSLNIFLRGVNYNRFLCDHYNLYRLEPWLELPLDSHVAKGLKLEPEGKVLKGWKGVIHLKPNTNEEYQSVAKKVANRLGIYRIHLDLIYWRGSHMDSRRLP
jgi:hypothetical protein